MELCVEVSYKCTSMCQKNNLRSIRIAQLEIPNAALNAIKLSSVAFSMQPCELGILVPYRRSLFRICFLQIFNSCIFLSKLHSLCSNIHFRASRFSLLVMNIFSLKVQWRTSVVTYSISQFIQEGDSITFSNSSQVYQSAVVRLGRNGYMRNIE